MSLYDEIISSQQDLEKLRTTRIFKNQDEATRHAQRHGMKVIELPAPREPGQERNTAVATLREPVAWQAVPMDHDNLRKREAHAARMAEHARKAKLNPLMRTVKALRDKLNEARGSLTKASTSNDEEEVMTATATLVDARRNLENAEENLVRHWNSAINRERPSHPNGQ